MVVGAVDEGVFVVVVVVVVIGVVDVSVFVSDVAVVFAPVLF